MNIMFEMIIVSLGTIELQVLNNEFFRKTISSNLNFDRVRKEW